MWVGAQLDGDNVLRGRRMNDLLYTSAKLSGNCRGYTEAHLDMKRKRGV